MAANVISGNVQVGTEGIKRNLRKFKVHQAISEYIWNGFDAGATSIDIDYSTVSDVGVISQLRIADNGSGIEQDKLSEKFEPFLHSNKTDSSPTSRNTGDLIRGKNGVGRLTFYHFAEDAEWQTVYNSNGEKKEYKIRVSTKNLENYSATEGITTSKPTGTVVVFSNIYDLDAGFQQVYDFLLKEFAWFIKLHECRGYKITVNGKEMDFSSVVEREESVSLSVEEYSFETRIVIWNSQLNKEFSKFYYSRTDGVLKYRETTSFNRKGDGFHHSLFISSEYFQNFVHGKKKDHSELDELFTNHSPVFLELKKQLNSLLADKRRNFIAERTNELVEEYEKEGVFPEVNKANLLDSFRHDQLKSIVGGLYRIEPTLFNTLSTTQKKTFVRLLDVVQVGHGVDDLLEIVKEVVNLDNDQRRELVELLKVTTLSSIIKTSKIIKDRFHAIELLEQLVFNKDRKANEVHHVQKIVEEHYWIFGAQYNLVTAAEPSFVDGLRRFRYILDGLDSPPKEVDIDHKDQNREPDIFMIRQDYVEGKRKCILVELKHPQKPLGDKEFEQVKKYLKVVTATDQFNGDDIVWEFHLVGNRLTRGNEEIPNALSTAKNYGKKGLVLVNDTHGYEVFVHRWSDMKVEIEHRLKFLQDKLELQRKTLVPAPDVTADQLVEMAKNSALQPKEMEIERT